MRCDDSSVIERKLNKKETIMRLMFETEREKEKRQGGFSGCWGDKTQQTDRPNKGRNLHKSQKAKCLQTSGMCVCVSLGACFYSCLMMKISTSIYPPGC